MVTLTVYTPNDNPSNTESKSNNTIQRLNKMTRLFDNSDRYFRRI